MPGQQAKRSTDIQAIGERVALRPLRQEDTPSVEAWYGQAAAAVYVSPDGEETAGMRYAIVLRGRDEGIGIIDVQAGRPAPGWLTIRRVLVTPALRARGYAAEAVILIETEAWRRRLARRFLALVGPDRGLAPYFWLRLGYRPARLGEVPWPGQPPQGIIAMVRAIDAET